MNWLDLLAVQGTLKSFLQHHSSKGSILWHSAFFIVQLSHPYMTTGKTIAWTRQTFVGKVMNLLFNMLSRLEKAMATHSSPLAWKIPWTEEPGRLQSMRLLRVGHNWATSLSCIGKGNGNPLQCSCLKNPRDGGLPAMGSHRVRHDWATKLKWTELKSSVKGKVHSTGSLPQETKEKSNK